MASPSPLSRSPLSLVPSPRGPSADLRAPVRDERDEGTPPLPQLRPAFVSGSGSAAGANVPLAVRSSAGETRIVSRQLRLGSAPDNDWVIGGDPHVSRYHAVLIPDGDRLRVRDLGSKNGTRVNGVPVQQAEVPFGACLSLGQTRLRLCAAGPAGLFGELLGDSLPMQRVRDRVRQLAGTELSVLILGESGTGKELVARALHNGSGRRGEFIAVNCGALPRELIESELFGHERGAFTGAQRRHLGCFGEAEGGTLFLDEVAELPLDLQPRLLRALENRTIRPVGSTREVPIDVRVVAATHCDLAKAVAQGRFRQDLYYRLFGADIHLPALRERPADIPGLVLHFLGEMAGKTAPCSISEEELAAVARHGWPGNVRELKNAVQRAAYLGGPQLQAGDLLGEGQRPVAPASAQVDGAAGLRQVVVSGRRFEEIERDIYSCVLDQTGNNRRAAAELLGLPRSSFSDKVHRLGLARRGG